MTYHSKVIAGGKMVLPADLRREFGIKDGDTLVVERHEGGGMTVKTFQQVIRDTQKRARAIFGPDYTVDQFIAERRAEEAQE